MISGVYKIENIETGEFYIGSSKNVGLRVRRHFRELTKGIHHCKKLQTAFKRFGKEKFKGYVVVSVTDRDQRLIFEQHLLDRWFGTKKCYNMSPHSRCGDLLSHHPDKTQIVAQIKKTLRELISLMTEEERSRLYGRPGPLNGMWGKTHTSEVKKRLSEVHKGNQYSKGAVRSPDTRRKLSEYAKKRIGKKNPFYGRKHSDETKLAARRRMLGRKPKNSKRVEIDGKTYPSASEAGRMLNIPHVTVSHRCKSKNVKFSNYKYLD